ncbi:hypothetical protein ABFX02_06G157500 [Erythranthe guttata]
MGSDDEDLYYEDVEEDVDSDDEGPEIVDVGDGGSRPQKHYTILSEEKIRQIQNNDISNVCSCLSVSRGSACTLLRLNNWNYNSVFEQWVSDEEKVRKSIGLLPDKKSRKNNNLCKICFDEVEISSMLSAGPCGHHFCTLCWTNYIAVSIDDGLGCLSLVCPNPKCKAYVGPELVDTLASNEDKDKYYRYLVRSYVEGHRDIKWCPGPACERAVQIEPGERENYDVACDCSHRFCWNCTGETHHPVDCKTVEKWIELNSSEAENTTWILAYTKPCPKCKRNIEKNQGCNHMTCRQPCGHHFCWLCLGPLDKSHTNCNMYRADEVGQKRVRGAREHLDRYSHYYERWALNHKSGETALSDLNRVRGELSGKKLAGVELRFVIEALERIVECRRELKWSYVYGYYLCLTEQAAKISFFEYLQGQAEENLERLHLCAETDMNKYLGDDCCPSGDDFVAFKDNLVTLTDVTRNYFGELVRALENDLSEVNDPRKETTRGRVKVYSKTNTKTYFNYRDRLNWM